MNKTTWIIFGAVCVALLGSLVVMSRKDRIDVSNVNEHAIQKSTESNGNIAEHAEGKTDAKVILIEYGDYQCPVCESAYPNVKKLIEEFGDRIAFVYRNFPITSIHPNAKAAASAAEAAGLQGKYWDMNNRLYESRTWVNIAADKRTQAFIDLAKAIGVKDIDKFKQDMGSTNVSKKIKFDMALADKQGVTGTPSFFLNGKKISEEASGSIINGDGSVMKKLIEDAL